ncbi:MAG: winged helix-turn-helix domain-containing protein [Burkholderiaceae bacterium]|nr:winged helix-turn-helix domain-containing protein [Burkholderiaceae bacterium]
MSENGFRFGDWQIDPDSNTLRNSEASANVEPKAMEVLRYLCRHAGAVIPPEELLQACWGNAELGDNPIHKAITQLRRALGDSASEPRYVETVRKRGYRAIAAVMTEEAALEGSWQQGSPFRGLESFQESHAAIFFGRLQATAQLRELVLKQTSDGCAMALVLGPSGSGKTSLVRAGLLPGLMASRTGSGEPVALTCTLYMDCADLADGNLFQALAAVLIDAEVGGKQLFADENAEALGRWLESSDASTIAGRLKEASGRIKIGLFIDRLEAIFRAPGVTDEMRSRFIAVLEHLAVSRAVLVMLACRNDFYPEVIALPLLMALKSRGGHFDLNPPDGAEIAQMVRMPAKAAGLKFEVDPATGAALDDVLCDAARGNPDTLPLLQYCLDELYRQRSEDGTLRFEVFRQLGGIEGAIAVRAEQVANSITPNKLAELPHVLSLLVDVKDTQSAVTARRAMWNTLRNAEAHGLVQALIEARLFVSELAGSTPCFGLAHEALLRQWPRVVSWIEKHRHAIQIRTRISQDASRWSMEGTPPELLIPPGILINQALTLLTLENFTLTTTEKTYIKASHSRTKFRERMKLAIMGLITLLAILAITLGIFAKRAQTNAETHRNEAETLMGYMLGEFAEKLRPIGKLELLNDISQKALEYLAKPASSDMTETTLTHRAKALQVVAEVNTGQSNSTKAIEALLAARTILQNLKTSTKNEASTIKDLGANAFWLGQNHLNMGNYDQSEKYFNDYKSQSERLAQLTNNDQASMSELSYAYSSLGAVAMKRRDLEKASGYFSQSIELKRKALDHAPNDKKIISDLANGLSWLANSDAKLGRLESALQLHIQEEKLLTPLQSNKPDDTKWVYLIANALWHQGELRIAMGQIPEGMRALVKAEELITRIIAIDPTNKTWKINLYTIRLRLYEQLSAIKGNRDVLDKQIKLITDLTELMQHDPKRGKLTQLVAWANLGIAENYLRLNEIEKSELYFNAARDNLENIQSALKSDIQVAIRFANSYLLGAEIKREKKEDEEAKKLCMQAKEVLKSHDRNTSDYYYLSPLVRSYACTGDSKSVSNEVMKLDGMNFKEPRYLSFLSKNQ